MTGLGCLLAGLLVIAAAVAIGAAWPLVTVVGRVIP